MMSSIIIIVSKSNARYCYNCCYLEIVIALGSTRNKLNEYTNHQKIHITQSKPNIIG